MESSSGNNSSDESTQNSDGTTNAIPAPLVDDVTNYSEEELKKAEEFKDKGN